MLGALFGFRGRLSRSGFWEVLMSVVLIDIALVIGRMYVADGGLPGGFGPSSQLSLMVLAALPWVLVIFTLWSLLAATVKRFHDRDRSGLMILIVLIPVFGWLWLLVDLFLLGGTDGKNRYGRAPHAPRGEAASEPARFDWSAEPAAPAPAPTYRMPDPEPANTAPAAELHAPEAEVHAEEAAPSHADDDAPESELHPADIHEPEPAPVVHEVVESAPTPAAEPILEPVHDHGPEPEPYDPLTAPLVMQR
jgi:uncharacterized membrane protein YhaH (DUF805 family)